MNTLFSWILENRALLVAPVFGFCALYLLLPRQFRFWRPVGVAFGVVALGVLGFLYGSSGAGLEKLLFDLFAGTAIVAAVATVTFPNPIYSALSFAVVTLSVSGLFVLRGALFLAATTVIIYAGAIVVTFLFIIMLSRHPGDAPYDRTAREPFLATLASFLLLTVLLFALADWSQKSIPIPSHVDPYSHSHALADEPSPLRGLGRTFFTDYLFIVELAGTLLLVAGIGAVAMAPRRVRPKQPIA